MIRAEWMDVQFGRGNSEGSWCLYIFILYVMKCVDNSCEYVYPFFDAK